MVKIIGCQRKIGEGDINGSHLAWDNVVFHCITDSDGDVFGQSTMQIKIKSKDFANLCGGGPEKAPDFIGHEVELSYFPRGKSVVLCGVDIVK